jgi:hypothetical protein
MANLNQIKEHMEIVGADGAHIGIVDKIEGDRIKLTKRDSGAQGEHHRYVSAASIAGVEGNKVRLSSAGAAALQQDKGGRAH